jgi:hypothetical protein
MRAGSEAMRHATAADADHGEPASPHPLFKRLRYSAPSSRFTAETD